MELLAIDGDAVFPKASVPGNSYVTCIAAPQHPLSRGFVPMTSANVSVYPSIQSKYFAAPIDLNIATAGTEYLRRIGSTKAYRDNFVVDGATAEFVPGTGADLREYTKATNSEYHPIGTCSMLPREDGGVVDASLKVYGTQNLGVVDTSIIPLHIWPTPWPPSRRLPKRRQPSSRASSIFSYRV